MNIICGLSNDSDSGAVRPSALVMLMMTTASTDNGGNVDAKQEIGKFNLRLLNGTTTVYKTPVSHSQVINPPVTSASSNEDSQPKRSKQKRRIATTTKPAASNADEAITSKGDESITTKGAGGCQAGETQPKTTEPVPNQSNKTRVSHRQQINPPVTSASLNEDLQPDDPNENDRNNINNEAGTVSGKDETITSKGAGGYFLLPQRSKGDCRIGDAPTTSSVQQTSSCGSFRDHADYEEKTTKRNYDQTSLFMKIQHED
eukprot:CAMPEP_0201277538 /NCGR_PEP_ID=MMETSP0853-20130426/59611_1 /ASSEMBLY_ACC=CAM_ASM_000640 /TAXON_ID=183588 /ORGANISM="Pseudo-nitzschia fraudulenta, Strain WWA7" /LENGTH=258 /DNA_ID=CAMNT_0047585711 /DNA_START=83 /DNA_END=861 /DNA_ORIENTATION=+